MNARMGAMETKLDALIRSMEALAHEVADVRKDVGETKEIVAAWQSVKLWASFVKWAAGIVTGGAVLFAALKGWWHR